MFEPSEKLEDVEPCRDIGSEPEQLAPSLDSTQTELSKSFYERYFLHFGAKAAATIQFVSELLESLQHDPYNFSQIIAKYEVGGEPLSFSVKPAIAQLSLSEDVLGITKKFWGDFMKLPSDRLTILPSDFISPMGYGVNMEAHKIPPKIFISSWHIADLSVSEKLGAVLYASFALWERCRQKLESLKNSIDRLPPAQQQDVDAINQQLSYLRKSEINESALFLGQAYFNKIDPSLKSRFDRTSSAIKRGGETYVKKVLQNFESSNLNASPTVTNPPFDKPLNPPLSPDPWPEILQSSQLPKRSAQSQNKNPSKSNREGSSALSSKAVSRKEEFAIDAELDHEGSPEGGVSRRYPLERNLVDTWRSKGGDILDLSAKLRVAFHSGDYVVAKLNSGLIVQGIPVVGGLQMDFFTIINEEVEITCYPKYVDVRRLDIFKFK